MYCSARDREGRNGKERDEDEDRGEDKDWRKMNLKKKNEWKKDDIQKNTGRGGTQEVGRW